MGAECQRSFHADTASNGLTPLLNGGSQISVRKLPRSLYCLCPLPKNFNAAELLNYTKANGQELVGLAVELAEDPSGGVQVRVLMDSNVVSGVTVVPLQQGGCCD